MMARENLDSVTSGHIGNYCGEPAAMLIVVELEILMKMLVLLRVKLCGMKVEKLWENGQWSSLR